MPVQPSSLAFSFIISAKASREPATCSAKAFAASFADLSNRACKQSFTVRTSPSSIWALEEPRSTLYTASWENVTLSSKDACSKTTRAVITLVILAGYSLTSPFFSNKTAPVSASTTMADSAVKSAVGQLAAIATTL